MTAVLTQTVSRETDGIPPVQQDRMHSDPEEPDDLQLLAVIGSQPRGSEQRDAACEMLVDRYRNLVRSCAMRYGRTAEPAEDLMQVGYVGLLKAINNFDLAYGRSLAAFAQPYVSGEIKRHFRDARWPIHVTRAAQDLAVELRAVTGQLTQDLGRTPAEPDLARYLGVSAARLREAQLAEVAFRPSSLDVPLSGRPGAHSLDDLLGHEDPRIDHMLGMHAVVTHWGELPTREQQVLLLRYRGGLTQAQIGKQLGLSQMQISRLLAHALDYLRLRLLGLDDSPEGLAH
jgi:RNA polymerase sigma-70 factor (sigma-B/F/G subfamily)